MSSSDSLDGNKKPFNLLAEFGRFGLDRKISLRDPASPSEFVHHVGKEVQRALDDEILLHGQRTEAMFESLLVSLGRFELLKAEDSGRLFPPDRYLAPDFRVVLDDGAHWLIEVKNVYEPDPYQQSRRLFNASHLGKLASYAEATGAKLKVAVFWARWSVWTLVSPERLTGVDGGLDIDMETALQVNELSRLGDRTVATRPPFRLRFVMDPARTSSIDADGKVRATIGEVQFFCSNEELTEPVEKEIAWMFMQYGDWQEGDSETILEGDRFLAIEFRWEPVEPTGQGFEAVGNLSNMFARYYAQHTVDKGQVVQLRAPLKPDWFVSLIELKGGSQALPLWQFVQEPNFDATQGGPEDGNTG